MTVLVLKTATLFRWMAILLVLINAWRATGGFTRHSTAFNIALMFAGFLLANYQLAGFFFGA